MNGSHEHHANASDHDHADAGAFPGGLRISQDGYTLAFEDTILPPGEQELRFRILDPNGAAVHAYTPIHERELHLIIARRELTGFWHVHPDRDSAGVWSIRQDLRDAGPYRVFTDIQPTELGRTITLGSDLAVAGDYDPRPVPPPTSTFVVDGYEVTLNGELRPDVGGHLTLTVRKDGVPVTDLQPYLGAYGHLVMVRLGPGVYRAFLDFQHGNIVRTAAFTVPSSAPSSSV
jgi:hypothetical protein